MQNVLICDDVFSKLLLQLHSKWNMKNNFSRKLMVVEEKKRKEKHWKKDTEQKASKK